MQYLSYLFDLCQQISNQKFLTRKQLKELNSSGFGKAILARWCVQNKKFTYAARTFLKAYELTKQNCLKFEAACAWLMHSKERYDDMFTVLNHNSKFLLQQANTKAIELLTAAAEDGHLQAAAAVLYIYMTSERKINITRRILFLSLLAADQGFVDGAKFPQRPLVFSLVPDSTIIKLPDKETFKEICRTLYVMSFDRLIKFSDVETEILTRSVEPELLTSLSSVDLATETKVAEKLFKVLLGPQQKSK